MLYGVPGESGLNILVWLVKKSGEQSYSDIIIKNAGKNVVNFHIFSDKNPQSPAYLFNGFVIQV